MPHDTVEISRLIKEHQERRSEIRSKMLGLKGKYDTFQKRGQDFALKLSNLQDELTDIESEIEILDKQRKSNKPHWGI